MEIYIDNKKVEFGKRRRSIGRLLKDITKSLEKNEKIIRSISINGNRLNDGAVLNIKEPSVIEVETKTYADLILESLVNAKMYIETFFEVREVILEKLNNYQELTEYDVEETHIFLNWFLDLLNLISQTYTFENDDLNKDFDELINILLQNIDMLEDSKKSKDYIGYVNILDLFINDILKTFHNEIDYYCEEIIKEENKKRKIV